MARAHGIDISYAQKTFDVNAKRDDVQFIIIRTSNGTTKDRFFDSFVESTAEVPIRGAYHYFRSEFSPVQQVHGEGKAFPWQDQADLFLALIDGKRFDFYALDYEANRFKGVLDNQIDEKFDRDFQAWMDYVGARVDKPLLVYTNLKWYRPWMKRWPLWIAQWWLEPHRDKQPALPHGVTRWHFWQYSAGIPPNGKGPEYGVASRDVDLNVFNGTEVDLRQWLANGHPQPSDNGEKKTAEDEASTPGGARVTWRDVLLAAQKVASRHGAVFFTWLREAGLAETAEDPAMWDRPYDGLAITKWPLTTIKDKQKIRVEIIQQARRQVLGRAHSPQYTWRDLILAANDVADKHGQNFFTWFREAGMAQQAEDPSLWDRTYNGVPLDEWEIPILIRMEIRRRLEENAGIEAIDPETLPPSGGQAAHGGSALKLDVPFRSQLSAQARVSLKDCGPACVSMLLHAHPRPDRPLTVDELYHKYLEGRQGNIRWFELKEICAQEKLGPEFNLFEEHEALQGLHHFIREGRPLIVLVNYTHWAATTRINFHGSHFVLVTGFDAKNVHVHDPLFAPGKGRHIHIPNELFMRGWGDFKPPANPRFSWLVTQKIVPQLAT